MLTKFYGIDMELKPLPGTTTSSEWQKWKRSFQLLMEVKAIVDKSKMVKHLLLYGGSELQDIFENIPKLTGVTDDFEEATKRLDSHFDQKTNHSYERYVFKNLHQTVDEPVNKYIIRLRIQANRCGFLTAQMDDCIKDQLLFSCTSDRLREKILAEDLNLANCIEAAQVLESTTRHLAEIKPTESAIAINRIHERYERLCYRCGRKGHISTAQQCPARNTKCHRCGKIGHFEKVCRTKSNNGKRKADYGSSHSNHAKRARDNNNRVFHVESNDRKLSSDGSDSNEVLQQDEYVSLAFKDEY